MDKARQPLRYVLSSVASFLVDAGLFYLLFRVFGGTLGGTAEIVCNVAARVVSSFFNFNVNRFLVFGGKGPYLGSLWRYYALAVPQAGASTGLLALFTWLLGISSASGSTAVKIAVDCFLFVLSYFIQKHWVFGRAKQNNK